MTKEERLNIHLENLSVFGKRSSLAKEARETALCHIVAELCADVDTVSACEELPSLYKELVGRLSPVEEMLLYEEMARSPRLASAMRSAFAVGSLDSVEAGSHGRIACVKNDFNNYALEQLSYTVTNAKPRFVSSFLEACEAVSDGECEFCILPIENASDGRMLGFYSMIDRYELKICRACDVDDEQSGTVRYALLSKSCPEPTDKRKSEELIFEFSVISDDGAFMVDMLTAAEKCGALPISLDCSPLPYDSRLRRYLLSFRISAHGSLLLRAFLSNSYHNYTPLGLYPEPTAK